MKVKNKSYRWLIGFLIIWLLTISSPHSTGAQTVPSGPDFPGDYRIFFPMLERREIARWLGPEGGSLTAMAIDPHNPAIVYVSSWGAGIFKSEDGGQSWFATNQGLGNLWINSLAIDPNNPAVLYAGTFKGKLYKSLDAGQSWFLASQNIQEEAIVYTIAIDPQDSSRVFIGTRGISNNGGPPWQGTAYKSSDAGQNWKPVLTDVGGASQQDWAYAIAVHPRNSSLIYATTHEHGVYRSTDGGERWYPANTGISDLSGRSLVVDPRFKTATLYLGVWHRSGIFKSINGGDSWQQKTIGIGDAKIYSLSLDPNQPDLLYAATFGHGVLSSNSAGERWYALGLDDYEITGVLVDPWKSGTLFAITHGDGLFRSLDGGASWSLSQRNLQATQINALWIDPAQPKHLFAGTFGGGMLRSTDAGSTWTPLNTNLPDRDLYNLVQHPQRPDLFFALTATAGLYRCDLQAVCWTPVNIGPAATENEVPAPVEPVHPRLAPDDWLGKGTATAAVLSQPALLAMQFAPSNAQIVYLGTAGQGLLKSANGGNTWQPTTLNSGTIWDLAVHPEDPAQVYALANQSIMISINGGGTWSNTGLTDAIPYTLAMLPNGTLLAGTSQGLYRYTGGSWSALGLGSSTISRVVQHPATSQIIYCGTTNGAFFSLDGGSSWRAGPPELAGLTILDITFDPNSRYVYYSTQTRGILRAAPGQ